MPWREIHRFTPGMWVASAALHAVLAVAATVFLDPGPLRVGVTLYCVMAAVAEVVISRLVAARGSPPRAG